jgi:flagellar hook assembly protein FlgD
MPEGSTLELVTVSGEKVVTLAPIHNRVEWNGKTQKGRTATSGIYYYILTQGTDVLEKGMLVLTNGAQ